MLDNLTRRMSDILGGLRRKGRLDEEDVQLALREVRVALLEADVNLKVAKQFVNQVKEKAVGEEIFGTLTADQTLIRIVRDELVEFLGDDSDERIKWSSHPPTVILMCGLQGSGKTTTTAKLARWLVKQDKKPLLVACDVQRPAAIKQLQVLGEQLDVPVYAEEDFKDPVAIAKRAIDRAKYLMLDVVIVDTAGRLSIDEALMQQLKEIDAAVKSDERFLVVDSTTGQEAVNVARAFHDLMPLTGAVFTKLDGDARGGAMLSVRAATGVPVRFIGVGEQTEALEPFYSRRMAERILGMGDVMGIIEKAEEAMVGEDVEIIGDRMKSGKLDFNDLVTQMRMVRRMGPIRNVMKMVPGLASQIPEEALDQIDDGHLNRIEAIVMSMTPKERTSPDILNGSRRRRIATGSGTKVEEVNRLVEQLYTMRKSMKQFTKLEKKMKRGRRR